MRQFRIRCEEDGDELLVVEGDRETIRVPHLEDPGAEIRSPFKTLQTEDGVPVSYDPQSGTYRVAGDGRAFRKAP